MSSDETCSTGGKRNEIFYLYPIDQYQIKNMLPYRAVTKRPILMTVSKELNVLYVFSCLDISKTQGPVSKAFCRPTGPEPGSDGFWNYWSFSRGISLLLFANNSDWKVPSSWNTAQERHSERTTEFVIVLL